MAVSRVSTSNRPYFPSLDGLRCLAILPVIWHHSTTHPMDGVLGRGPIGVELFFALSGFLITTLLLHEKKTGTISLGAFWWRRSLRIFPLYYFVLGAFVLHALFVREPGAMRDHFLDTIPYYATYTSNWFSYKAVDHAIVFAFAWSLAAEEQFYLLWPPLLRALRRPALAMAALVLLDQAAERGWLAPFLDEGLALRMIRSFATPIGLGSLLALANDHPKTSRVLRLAFGQRWSSILALGAVALALVYPLSITETHVALVMLVGSCALRRDHYLAPLLESRPLRHIGTVSYGMYLLNVPVVTLLRNVLGREKSAFYVFSLAVLVTIGVATLTYRLIERPFLALKDRRKIGTLTAFFIRDNEPLS